MDKAITKGTTIAEFRKDFDKVVKQYGWSYNGGRNWRTRIIYQTNIRQAYNAGRWAQLQKVKKHRPYLQYIHSGSAEPRLQHKAWHGLILPVDHPFWHTHFPQNGWGCKCRVRSLSQREMDKNGWSVSKAPDTPLVERTVKKDGIKQIVKVPSGIDPGFDYNVGQSWTRPFTPIEDGNRILRLATKPPKLPLPKATPIDPERLLPKGLSNEEYAGRFLAEFGGAIGKPVPFRDKAGGRLLVSEDLFKNIGGNWKVAKDNREVYLLLLADTIKDPDEIWIAMEYIRSIDRYVLRRRYLKRLRNDDGHGFAMFQWSKQTWARNITAYSKSDTSFDEMRVGTLVYQKK